MFVAIEEFDGLSDGESLSAKWYPHQAAGEFEEALRQQMPEIAKSLYTPNREARA